MIQAGCCHDVNEPVLITAAGMQLCPLYETGLLFLC